MRRARALPRDRDAGLTLTELLVSMGIFTIVLVVFMGGLLTMTRSTVRAQDVTDAGDALRKAFQTMDREIRYSSSINLPGTGPSGAHYVEFITTERPDDQEPLCTQWRYDPSARTLQVRTWLDVPSATRGGWRMIATDVRNDVTGTSPRLPFVVKTAGGTFTRQQLEVNLDVGRGDPGPGQTTGADVATTFVARNSSYQSPSNADLDGDGQSDTPVCATLLERP